MTKKNYLRFLVNLTKSCKLSQLFNYIFYEISIDNFCVSPFEMKTNIQQGRSWADLKCTQNYGDGSGPLKATVGTRKSLGMFQCAKPRLFMNFSRFDEKKT